MFPTTTIKNAARNFAQAGIELRLRAYEFRHLPEEDKRRLVRFGVVSVLIVALLVSVHQVARYRVLTSGSYSPVERALLSDLIRNTTGYQ